MVVGLLLLWIGRGPILRGLGRSLVRHEAVTRADIIVIAVAADGAGVLEAADLVHGGVADRVAIFEEAPTAADREFLRRALPHEDDVTRSMRQLASLGITRVERIPRTVEGTESEGEELPRWCAAHEFGRVVVVTSADHSRRMARVLRRAMRGSSTQVAVRSARYSAFREDEWWQSREGVRIAVIEWEKLFLDVVRHPFS